MVDEEVAIRMRAPGVSWILSCVTKILLQRNNVLKRCEVLERMPSSSTACAVPRKARFACKRCYEGSPELFPAGEGLTNRQIKICPSRRAVTQKTKRSEATRRKTKVIPINPNKKRESGTQRCLAQTHFCNYDEKG